MSHTADEQPMDHDTTPNTFPIGRVEERSITVTLGEYLVEIPIPPAARYVQTVIRYALTDPQARLHCTNSEGVFYTPWYDMQLRAEKTPEPEVPPN